MNERERLRRAIAESDMTQEEIAAEAGYDQGHLSRVLNGRRPLHRRFVIAVARAIGCDPDQILERVDKDPAR